MNFFNKYRAFKAGQLTQKETEEFVAWMNSREGEEKILEEIEEDWNYLDAKEATDETRLESIFSQIKEETKEERSQNARNGYFSKIAAAVALLVTFAGLTYLIFPELQTLNQPHRIVKSNPSGQKSTHFLPDGSKVFLNAESSISYSADFEGSLREIELKGEAYFEVAKNPQKPFVVKSKQFSTTALGTAFNVRAYGAESKLDIALTEGKIKVDSETLGAEYYLKPGEQLSYSSLSKKIEKIPFDKDEITGWKDGLIKFSDANYEEVKNRLGRWFGVNIHSNKQPAEDWRYTGVFENQSLEMILEGMKLTKNFEYKMERKRVEIMFK
ncbi:FecR family protein [Reichenbachiella faecimaris]|uniref:FecR family protein n=1 Tax=Reichenbachiella faecimaris TaxID=692418 RepID=A0A1W2GEQ9_REIFA|nr:FecR family protein [Reichenbachiella faecimaris]SMD35135.1 FecR family protein [Reichenbachiella faecimaris]